MNQGRNKKRKKIIKNNKNDAAADENNRTVAGNSLGLQNIKTKHH